jgi:hypothetical protein
VLEDTPPISYISTLVKGWFEKKIGIKNFEAVGVVP